MYGSQRRGGQQGLGRGFRVQGGSMLNGGRGYWEVANEKIHETLAAKYCRLVQKDEYQEYLQSSHEMGVGHKRKRANSTSPPAKDLANGSSCISGV